MAENTIVFTPVMESLLVPMLESYSAKDYEEEIRHALFKVIHKTGLVTNEINTETISDAAELISYTIGEIKFMHDSLNFDVTEETYDLISDHVIEKYKLAAETAFTDEVTELNAYNPKVSSMVAALSYFYNINKPLVRNHPGLSLVHDIFNKTFKMIYGLCSLLEMELYSDAYSQWRGLHEAECVLKHLVTGGDKLRAAYVNHIVYNNAYRNPDNFTKEWLDNIFEGTIKPKMKEKGLKSKDIKKYIEYGWIFSSPAYDPTTVGFKLNFRDAIEDLAGLREYNKVYEGASEVSHSSCTSFYVNEEYCKNVSLQMLYESSMRVFSLFMEYMHNYFDRKQEEKNKAERLCSDLKKVYQTLELGVFEEDDKDVQESE